ncbi:AraC family transcriptional regulator [Paenibacillus mucilaginosus 3016]|uniref:AraC family transcriptional regulator n=1 Tax=Paenibacillus mucilaginosus 3016 TaxID=1116391 RepID=H6NGP7_9BACL|nr:AraC family transcriptional regulator [Paenibacillus mucilaginosus]AFC33950.1 AraC family transcriptional regulator [Paenibacillus mucilaginosus 3016]WFA22324.1 AraC family transcriptional regulator [Paenibacillus mucilaginosus]
MPHDIRFYRDPALPQLECKVCAAGEMPAKKHFHEEYSLGIVEDGASRVWCDGRELDMKAGRLIWIPPYVPHACSPLEASGWRYKMLFIHAEWMEGLGEELRLSGPSLVMDRKSTRRSRGLMNRVAECLAGRRSPLETETRLLQLAGGLLNPNAEVEAYAAGTAGERRKLARVQEYLHAHALEGVTLERLEAVSGLSRFRLVHRFTGAFRIPPHAYQTMLRLHYAKRELAKRRSIAEVAAEAGFYDQSHFTKSFKSYTGVTPLAYTDALR